jgi:hypothetical protein
LKKQAIIYKGAIILKFVLEKTSKEICKYDVKYKIGVTINKYINSITPLLRIKGKGRIYFSIINFLDNVSTKGKNIDLGNENNI